MVPMQSVRGQENQDSYEGVRARVRVLTRGLAVKTTSLGNWRLGYILRDTLPGNYEDALSNAEVVYADGALALETVSPATNQLPWAPLQENSNPCVMLRLVYFGCLKL